MQLSYDQYRIIKQVVEFNTNRINRPVLDQDYMMQINNAFDLMRMVLPHNKPIFMMAPKHEHVRNFQARLNGHNRTSGIKLRYISDYEALRGIQDAVLIILNTGTFGRYADERRDVLQYIRELPDHYHIDLWNIGET